MTKEIINLTPFRYSHFSQHGEDGVVEKLLAMANIRDGFLVEVGAWDGIYLSNIYYHHKKNPAFKTMFIEADEERFDLLKKNIPQNENNILLNLHVDDIGENSLNELFKKYRADNIAVLSIDVDGDDLDLFISIDTKVFRPAIIIIECGKWANDIYLQALENIFDASGYSLVHVTGNFIFMDNKYGIRATQDIHQLIRKSGVPEYDLFYSNITEDQKNTRNEMLKDREQAKFLYSTWAGGQLIEAERV